MGNAFQDQFLKLGLVDEKKLKQAKQEKHKQVKQVQHGKKPAVDERQRAAQQAQAQKAVRDRELNEQRQAETERKAQMAQVKQLVTEHRLPKDGEVPFNFTDGSRIRRLYVTEAQRALITAGSIGIVKFGGRYELVPADVAKKIAARVEACVIRLPASPEESAPAADDPYADYKVPDDLIW